MDPRSILFLCIANSARSQLAEALARARLGDRVRVQSAGSAPTRLQPLVAEVLAERGLTAAGLVAKDVATIDPASVDTVITLCAEEACPAFLGGVRRLHWPIPDPAGADAPWADPDAMRARFRAARDQLDGRLAILEALRDAPPPLAPHEHHASLRSADLPRAVRFYAWLLGVPPREWTHRYATFISEPLRLNFVVVVADDAPMGDGRLYHLGVALADRAAVIDAYHRAVALGVTVHKPPRTTWRGTPLHELWLRDPDGNLVELYARLTETERAASPANLAPTFLVPGTAP